MDFTVYDKTGKILRSGSCQRVALARQAGEGQYVLAGRADDAAEKVDLSGPVPALVRKSQKEIEADNAAVVSTDVQTTRITAAEHAELVGRLAVLETELAELKASAAKDQASR